MGGFNILMVVRSLETTDVTSHTSVARTLRAVSCLAEIERERT